MQPVYIFAGICPSCTRAIAFSENGEVGPHRPPRMAPHVRGLSMSQLKKIRCPLKQLKEDNEQLIKIKAELKEAMEHLSNESAPLPAVVKEQDNGVKEAALEEAGAEPIGSAVHCD